MIVKSVVIRQHHWRVTIFLECRAEDAGFILAQIARLSPSPDTLRSIARNLTQSHLNSGLTFTSRTMRETMMVISATTSAEEFFNTFLHELQHAEGHILPELGIPPTSEQAAYFRGGLARDIYPHIKHLLCECCRFVAKKTRK